jgi:mono/diheme cytochrome c family protein
MGRDRLTIRTLPVVILMSAVASTATSSGTHAARGPQAITDQPSTSRSGLPASPRALIAKYCVSCHNQKLRTAGLALDGADVDDPGTDAELWEKVIRKLRVGAMPPPGLPRPDPQTLQGLVSGLETAIDRAAATARNPGRTETFHRLNRAEYANAIRDLLGLDLKNLSALLPADDAGHQGFDNIADVLSVSPALLDRYMSAARQLSRLAVGLAPPGATIETYRVSSLLVQDDRVDENLPFGSRGGIAIHQYFPVDGEYSIKLTLQRTKNSENIVGLGRPHELDVRVDGVRVARFTVGGEDKGKPAPQSFAGRFAGDPDWERYVHHADEALEMRFFVKAGQRVVGVSFVKAIPEPVGVLQPRPEYTVSPEQDELQNGSPGIEVVAIGGPYVVSGPGDTPSRRRIFACQPTRREDEKPCARNILRTLARRAYRGAATERDVEMLLRFFESGQVDGGFEAGVQLAIERILVDPRFLFRVESDPPDAAPGSVYPLSGPELASRLSFFLWSSIPDDELLDLAIRGKLDDPVVVERQVRRMLSDPRSRALVDNFAGQWLQLRNLRHVTPDPALFPSFDENLRDALQQETELFVDSQLREDRSVVDLLSANYTFLNERLARHYDIPNVHGSRFRKVTLTTERRGGLLGHGSLLTLTSYPNRTSPVVRGKWMLETLLGSPPPPPPPDVPSLPERGDSGAPTSVRARLESHRRNPQCASCHAPMDPLGFALENFDAIGAWRTSEGGVPIDASGTMPGGPTFNGPAELRAFLLSRRGQFVDTVTSGLLTYALGRSLEYYDLPTVRSIVGHAAPSEYRWSSLILGIVKSAPFRMRKARPQTLEPTPARVASVGRETRADRPR